MKQYFLSLTTTYTLLIMSYNIWPNYDILDITKLGHEQYQHIVINGTIVPNMPPSNGQQPEKRYEVIESFLKQYKRPFTMLDIGAAQGYHSLKAAWQFPDSVFVMIEGNNNAYPYQGDQLLSICKCNNQLNNIIHLNKSIVINDLLRLGECEHFDVVLALNILHWLGNTWKNAVESLLYLGDNIIIETPPAEESEKNKQIINYLESLGATKIAEVPRHVSNKKSPIYLLQSDKSKMLERSTWIRAKENSSIKKYTIISDFFEKKLKKIDVTNKPYQELTTPWYPGINLITFKMYNGSYPLSGTLKNDLERLKDEPHNDWQPNNFIVQGNKLKMIDYNSLFFMNAPVLTPTYSRYNIMLKFLEATDPQEILSLFIESTGTPRIIC